MIQQFEQIRFLYGEANVQIPNSLFKKLSESIRDSKGDRCFNQVSFAYTYLVALAFLYKYAMYVDIDNETYIQNSNLKELLGYNKKGKSIDKIITKNGILEKIGLVSTSKDYPVRFYVDKSEGARLDDMPLWEFIMHSELTEEDVLFEKYKKVVKNRNYEIREPLFLTSSYEEHDNGTLYGLKRTHQITISELITFLSDEKLNNIGFAVYAYLKSKCKGNRGNEKKISLEKIRRDTGVSSETFLKYVKVLEEHNFISVNHGVWRPGDPDKFVPMIANEYCWKGVSC